jgi:hypothetical protein
MLPSTPGQEVDSHMQKDASGASKYESVKAVQAGRAEKSYGKRGETNSDSWEQQYRDGLVVPAKSPSRCIACRRLVGHDSEAECRSQRRHRSVDGTDDEPSPKRV